MNTWKVWVCPVCGWLVDDILYLSIIIDPDCPGCGVRKYSQFYFREISLEDR